MIISDWHGLYREGWRGEIVPEAFSHPAKFARGLIRHIYEHVIGEDWLKPGDTVVDPFGGVALGSLDAMRHGLNWLGCELEERFVDLGNQNIELWLKRYAPHFPNWGTARLIRGDSRELANMLGEASACISSPPYAEARIGQESGQEQCGHNDAYGATPGQLGSMKAGKFDAAISSPPFEATVLHNGGKADYLEAKRLFSEYGTSKNNIGNSTGDDFWIAARTIVEQVYQVLRPGGHAIWVVKAFVKNKKRVDFPGQWQQLCEAVGFETLHYHRAWLVEHKGIQFDLSGKRMERVIERKSFFRRLAEKKAQAAAFWIRVSRQDKARHLWKAHNDLWRYYHEQIAEKHEDEDPPMEVTKYRITGAAQMSAWNEAGNPTMEIDTRIDFEVVLCMRKPDVSPRRD